ncbi:hypothetical protein MAPG_08614 [Magnaporthiopsis poae ATCC 64411]|uniref:Uncharacterized protein n=1 Tax=Magnaporthiopsis poae (strain ATCC 64411 / 73-15) TaxID=644358 RepID=A0A0C4E7U1_MAGP6|nr:hypothetical protein MAPG_08614 [Magnaporthiopsis poae ATCC 64411]
MQEPFRLGVLCSVVLLEAPQVSGLYYAYSHGFEQAAVRLIQEGADVNTEGGTFGDSHQAVSLAGHAIFVRLLLSSGANADTSRGMYGGALQAASMRGWEEIIRPLLYKEADPEANGAVDLFEQQ